MWITLKYGIWNVAQPEAAAVNTLTGGGFSPLTAMILAARGLTTPQQARAFLDCAAPLPDPFLLNDMAEAAARIHAALARGERIAVFGDYDVDGVTATCLLTDYLRSCGADCVPYIPGRLEEGYGLNPIALRQLHGQGVTLVVTVDCGVTAVAEAALCRELGMDLIVTDHHECKSRLPDAVAVVDPHRPDSSYPHRNLSGVGVAFKLASALCGSQEKILARYADMVCLGTVADVMLLVGENRVFVSRGLRQMRTSPRPGIAALIARCGADPAAISASTISFTLSPRINAAGRMGKIGIAVELFLTDDAARADFLAGQLCELNRQRRDVEAEIYRQATAMLPADRAPEAIVLADARWHQGVVGIVASRICEEYCCPTVLICLDGEHGKASSRSYGGFNLFTSLTELAPLLESYGGHELAAGFTISRANIPAFRDALCRLAGTYFAGSTPHTTLDVDCAVSPELLTLPNVAALSELEPCGNGCPRPVLMLEGMTVSHIQPVGGGKHMRLRLRRGHTAIAAIYFSATPASTGIAQGDLVDVAFTPQINDYRQEQSVQLTILDIRPSCKCPCPVDMADYRAMRTGTLSAGSAGRLLPPRATLAMVWRYLSLSGGFVQESPVCLCRRIVRWAEAPLSLACLMTCLDIFSDVGLLETERKHHDLAIRLLPHSGKADLQSSSTMQRLLQAKES